MLREMYPNTNGNVNIIVGIWGLQKIQRKCKLYDVCCITIAFPENYVYYIFWSEAVCLMLDCIFDLYIFK